MPKNLPGVVKKQDASYGIIGINQHRIDCIVGIYPEERERQQPVLVDLNLQIDFTPCLQSRDFTDTIDYVLLAQLCTELAHEKKYFLLEIFASDILDQCMKRFSPFWAYVRIQKPAAILSAACAFVEMECGKKE